MQDELDRSTDRTAGPMESRNQNQDSVQYGLLYLSWLMTFFLRVHMNIQWHRYVDSGPNRVKTTNELMRYDVVLTTYAVSYPHCKILFV
jgi:hypothetical protein